MIGVKANGADLSMELNTGAAVSIVSEETYKKTWQRGPPLEPTSMSLRTYTGEELETLGTISIQVQYKGHGWKRTKPFWQKLVAETKIGLVPNTSDGTR